MATIRDVAARAGVSVATVSYVINGTKPVAPETAARVRRAMEELDYHPDASAQSLRTRTTHVIGVVVSDIANPFFATLVRGAEDCARQHGYSLLICNTGEDLENERIYLSLLSRRRVDGLLLAPTGKNDELIGRLIDRGMNIVFIDRTPPHLQAPAVLSQNEAGAYQATCHLIERGHRRIGIVLGLPDVSTTAERLRGYRRALAHYGLELDEDLLVYGRSQVAGAREACLALLSRPNPPTAIFATNNLMTIGAMQAIRKLSLRCPGEVSVVGFDDFEWAEAFDPPLTTVAQDPYGIGQQAVGLLLGLLSGDRKPEQVRLPVELRVRGSVARLEGG
ncbi:MAG: Transcriptional regulator [Acetothermia bacterium 64_32]|nr:MAG: Transcriptional regulator [Acetothermia bacterium 64_32]HAF70764.1 LacI family transcriptional regulator [Candidatus Acetothermia bacterium]